MDAYSSKPVGNDRDEGGLDLPQLLGTLRRQLHVIAGVTVVVATSAVFKAVTDTPVYRSKVELLTEPVSLETQVISSTNPETLSNKQEIVAVELDEASLKILKSPMVMTPVVEQLQEKYPDIGYGSVVSKLEIKRSDNSKLLEVAYQSTNSQQVQDVLELVAKAYLKYSLETRQTDISRGIEFLEQQLPQLRSRVEALQQRLQDLRQESNLIEPANQAQQLSEQLGNFTQQQLEVQAQLNEARLLADDLDQELAQQPIESAAASALSSPSFQAILEEIRAIDTERAKESVLFFEESAELNILSEQRQKLADLLRQEAQQIQREADSRIRELQIRDQAYDQAIAQLNQDIKQLSVTTRKYTDLQRELEIASNNLNQFIAKREALRIDAAQREVPWELITPPTEPQASSASVKRNLVLGTALGLLLGVGIALVLDKLSNILYTSKEIRDAAQLPLLGVIPYDKRLEETSPDTVDLDVSAPDLDFDSGQLQSELSASASLIEAFRSLYSNIRLLNPDTPVRSLVISSSTAGEGKSTVAIHLAKAAAAMGRHVLLVDTNLRNPRLQERMGLDSGLGLTDIISEIVPDFHYVVQRTSIEENLFVLTSGPTPPDPSRLLASEKMQNLMRELKETFDLIIYDAPILTGFVDTHVLGSATSGVVLVTSVGKLKRSDLKQALEQLNISRTPVLGIVANRDREAPFGFNEKGDGINLQAFKPVLR